MEDAGCRDRDPVEIRGEETEILGSANWGPEQRDR